MLLNNARLGSQVNYFSIQQVTDKARAYWIAWYYEDVQQNPSSVMEVENANT